jgi:hypothetical protein
MQKLPEAMDDVTGQVGDDLTQMADDTASAITTAVDQMVIDAALGADDIAALIADLNTKEVTIPVNYTGGRFNYDGTPDFDGDPTNSFARGTMGFVDFGRGTPAVLHNEEIVATRDQMDRIIATALHSAAPAAATPGYGGPERIEIPISIGGDVLDRIVIRRTRAGWMRE